MKLWCKVMAVVLALLWVPVTGHCLMENAGFIAADACCADAAPAHGHEDSHGACQVESNQFAAHKEDFLQSMVIVAVVILDLAAFESTAVTSAISASGVAPVDLRPSWHLDLCTSLPARAPSLLS
jgi:hypothetical protein